MERGSKQVKLAEKKPEEASKRKWISGEHRLVKGPKKSHYPVTMNSFLNTFTSSKWPR